MTKDLGYVFIARSIVSKKRGRASLSPLIQVPPLAISARMPYNKKHLRRPAGADDKGDYK